MLGSHSPLAGAAALTDIPLWCDSHMKQCGAAVHAGDEQFFADSIKVN